MASMFAHTIDLNYRLATPDEAPRVAAFVRRIYGENYPSDLFADHATMAQLMAEQRLYCSVAENAEGEILGHLGMFYETDTDLTCDSLAATVDPKTRGHNVMVHLAFPLMEVCTQRSTIAMHQYATTLHGITQRRMLDNGGVVTGVLLAEWPGGLDLPGFEPKQALPSTPLLTMYFPFYEHPQRQVYLPPPYATLLEQMYADLKLPRALLTELTPINAGPSETDGVDKPVQGIARFRFHSVGEDACDLIDAFAKREHEFNALYVDLALDQPIAEAVWACLREQGWFFGCLLPERRARDYLRLQRTSHRPALEAIDLEPDAHAIWHFLNGDRP